MMVWEKDKQLIDACKSGDLAAVQKLLDEGVDVDWKDIFGMTALMRVVSRQKGHVDVAKLLLDRGAQINMQHSFGGGTALMWAILFDEVDCVRLLLERGADMSIQDKRGRTAKALAKNHRHDDIVQLLDEVRISNNSNNRLFFIPLLIDRHLHIVAISSSEFG
jgi:ankyrin repeat protein